MSKDHPLPQYSHPGIEFLLQNGALSAEEDVYRYVDFLRYESQVSDNPPIDLSKIYQRFGIPTPRRVPLEDQQGILVDGSAGKILIKEDDPPERQRFTEGHELMELLFHAHENLRGLPPLPIGMVADKEKFCDCGASELLMPRTSFAPQLEDLGISLETAQRLASAYQTSLLATLSRMMQLGQGDCVLVMWHYALKPSEIKHGCSLGSSPQPKLRIKWSLSTKQWTGGFVPKDKSVPSVSLLFQAYESGQSIGTEVIDFGPRSISCLVEAMRVQIGNDNCVLAILHRHEN